MIDKCNQCDVLIEVFVQRPKHSKIICIKDDGHVRFAQRVVRRFKILNQTLVVQDVIALAWSIDIENANLFPQFLEGVIQCHLGTQAIAITLSVSAQNKALIF